MNDARDKLKAVYQDLRNQRLLPVAVVLIIAIVAVPMALGSGSADVAPKTELAVGIEPLAETQPVVVAATPELRNFHKRLNEFAKKNPFHQPAPLPVPKSGSSDGSGTDAAAASSIDAAATSTAATSTDTSATAPTTPTDTATTPTDTGTTPTDTGGTGSTGTDTTGTGTGTTGAQVLTYEVDVLVGAAGEEKEMDGVKTLDLLPGKTHPVLQYVTTDLGGNRASFIVSNAVTGADGDGRCAPSPVDCQFLQLKVGQSERLDYGPTSRTYRIKLLAITQHVDPLDVAGNAAGNVSGRIGFSAGLPSADINFTPAG